MKEDKRIAGNLVLTDLDRAKRDAKSSVPSSEMWTRFRRRMATKAKDCSFR